MTAAQIVETLLDDTEIEDIACDFIENEVGRLDWMRNWEVFKRKPNAGELAAQWLSDMGHSFTPQELFSHIEGMVGRRAGKWQ